VSYRTDSLFQKFYYVIIIIIIIIIIIVANDVIYFRE